MQRQFLLYGHGGAYNHGAEAIVKCTVDLIKEQYKNNRIILSTHFKGQDIQFNMPVDEYCERNPYYVELDKNSGEKGNYNKLIYKETIDKIKEDFVCLSVGGDNYCYNNWHRWKTIHEVVILKGAKSILWSCSIEPSMMNSEMINVLKTHHLITARESITYNALLDRGLDNVVLCSDIAFQLEPEKVEISERLIEGNTVAINISPLVVRREKKHGIIVKNIKELIKYIITKTDMNIALIPHVEMPMDNDFNLLREIYKQIGNQDRVALIPNQLSAAEYKYIMSKCRFSICSRTHASIAAYSLGIPTIAIGYSVKARGIGKDLGCQDYVIPVENFINDRIILDNFKELQINEEHIKNILENKLPEYIQKAKVHL